MSELAYKAVDSGAVAQFDAELNRLEEEVNVLEMALEPVLNRYDDEKIAVADAPRPEPTTALHGRIERLGYLSNRISNITRRTQL